MMRTTANSRGPHIFPREHSGLPFGKEGASKVIRVEEKAFLNDVCPTGQCCMHMCVTILHSESRLPVADGGDGT